MHRAGVDRSSGAGSVGLLLAVAAAGLAISVSAAAQQGPGGGAEPTDEARLQAREQYSRGQEQFRSGEFVEAQAWFEAAYATVQNPLVLLGIAETQERQGNFGGTVTTLERYLQERADAPDRGAIEVRIATHRARPAILAVTSVPPGASVVVDGAASRRTTPARIELPPGPHVVTLQLDGYEPLRDEITLEFASRRDRVLTLVPLPITQPASAPVPAPVPPVEAQAHAEQTDGAGEQAGSDERDRHVEPSYGAAYWAGGIGAAALVAGTVLGFMALGEQADFNSAPSERAADRGERLALFADVAFAIAASAFITGLVLYTTEGEDDGETAGVRIAPAIGPGYAGLCVRAGL